MHYNEIIDLMNNDFKNKKIDKTFPDKLNNFFNKKKVIDILKDILNNESLIEKIANRSYLHTLGFYKIVLIDSDKDLSGFNNKTQLRLHLWKPENDSVPIVESLHEHSFDFVSTLLTGEIENQSFQKSDLTCFGLEILEKTLSLMNVLGKEEKKFLEEQLDILMTYNLKNMGSMQFDLMAKKLEIEKLKEITGFSDEEVNFLSNIQGFYKSDRIQGEKKNYKHILEKYIELKPFSVLKIKEGQVYFHPYQLPHRLFYNNKEYNSTILITTHVPENAEGGSFQRPSYSNDGVKNYGKKAISKEDLVVLFNEYISELKK